MTNSFHNQPADQVSVFRLGIEGSNGDIWESNVNQNVNSTTLTTYLFDISEAAMTKQVNETGTGTLADTLASVVDVRFIFGNSGNGVQDLTIDNLTVIPEPAAVALLASIAALGVVLVRRRRN